MGNRKESKIQPADSLRKSARYFLIKTLSTAQRYATPPRYDSQDVDAVIYISISKQNQYIYYNISLYPQTVNTMYSVFKEFCYHDSSCSGYIAVSPNTERQRYQSSQMIGRVTT